MLIKQISVFVENKTGRLADVTAILGDCGINIHALSIADTTDFGILRLIVSDADKAEAAIKAKGLAVRATEVLAVSVEDRPGGIARALRALDAGGISIEYLYAFMGKSGKNAPVILKVNDFEKAARVLDGAGISIIKPEEMHSF